MSDRPMAISFQQAFEAEQIRRETERQAREDTERAQQEADHSRATALFEALTAESAFLNARKLTLDRSRYAVTLDHAQFRLRAYFEAGDVSVTSGDKRDSMATSAAPRKQATVKSAEEALSVLAQFLADEVGL
jgi:hypothetical protein